MTPDFDSKKVIKKSGRAGNRPQGYAQEIPFPAYARLHGSKSECSGTNMQVTCLSHVRFQGSECGGVVQYACTCLSHARLQGSECSGVVQYACDMPDFKAVKVYVVEL